MFATLVTEAADFELALSPDLNIVCYRYLPPSWRDAKPADIDQLQRDVRAALLADGTHYIVATTLPSGFWLRSAFMNPMATDDDLHELLAHIRSIGRAIAA